MNPLQIYEADEADVPQQAFAEGTIVDGQGDADRQYLEGYVAQQDQGAQCQQDEEEGGDGSLEVAASGQRHEW